MTRTSFGRLAFASALAFVAAPALAASIAGLHNTGSDADTNARDDYWTLQVTGGSTPGYAAATNPYVSQQASGFPFGPWIANDATSRWLTPLEQTGASLDASTNGTYLYSLTFDLTGFDADTASLSGRWASDNNAIATLNGTQFSFTGVSGFGAWTPFTVDSGFVSGLNTLAFTVTNISQSSGNPTGFRAEFVESAVAAVPEPQQWALLLVGLGMMGTMAARRRSGSA